MKLSELPLGTLFKITDQHTTHLPKGLAVICYIGKFGITITDGHKKFAISHRLHTYIKPKSITLPTTPCFTESDVANLYPEYFI